MTEAARRTLAGGSLELVTQQYEGSHCLVFQGWEPALERHVAVKLTRPDQRNAAISDLLRREARLRAQVSHHHVLPLLRLVEVDGSPALVGPWLAGGSLAGRLGKPLEPPVVLAMVEEIAGALDAVHRAGWLHGDVSAGNILFDNDGRAVLADFATAQPLGWTPPQQDGAVRLTITPAIAAPEAWLGLPLDGRADLFALAVLTYAMLTGGYPWTDRVTDGAPPPSLGPLPPAPSQQGSEAGAAGDAVVLRALARDRDERFPTGAALAAALRAALLQDGVLTRPRFDPTATSGRSGPPFADAHVQAAGRQIDRFAGTLDDRERLALSALLERVRQSEARAVAEVTGLTSQVYGPPAALLALEQSGAAAALAEAPCTAAELAAASGVAERNLGQILEVLAATGILSRAGDRFSLPPYLGFLYRSYGRLGTPATPVQEAAAMWAHLPAWLTRGKPYLEMDRRDGATYSGVVGVLGTLYTAGARELADGLARRGTLAPGARVLDIGAGSGVWSLALAGHAPDITVTAVDRGRVLDTTRTYAEAAGLAERLTTLDSDWRDAPLPDDWFDIVIMANVCHLEPGWEVERMAARARQAVRPGGLVLVVDTIPEARDTADPRPLLQGLRLGLRTPAGGVHDEGEYRAWLGAAGLVPGDAFALAATENRLRVLLATRPAPVPA